MKIGRNRTPNDWSTEVGKAKTKREAHSSTDRGEEKKTEAGSREKRNTKQKGKAEKGVNQSKISDNFFSNRSSFWRNQSNPACDTNIGKCSARATERSAKGAQPTPRDEAIKHGESCVSIDRKLLQHTAMEKGK
jgi:hypothetical protein